MSRWYSHEQCNVLLATHLHAVVTWALQAALNRCQKAPPHAVSRQLTASLVPHTASDQESLRPLEENPYINAKRTGVVQGCGFNKQGRGQYCY